MQLMELWIRLAQDLLPAFRHYRTYIRTLDIQIKADTTLLTEADLAVEQLIVERIREMHPDAVVVAEEDGKKTQRVEVLGAPEFVWVIDPIDGTAEFVRPGRVEFCSVICLLQDLRPVGALVLAPELGRDHQPLTIIADTSKQEVTINGQPHDKIRNGGQPLRASVTRSSTSSPRAFEEKLRAAAYTLKTRTTSQTLDMVRTAVDIDRFTAGGYEQFSIFYRENQKVWDGLAGLCLGETVGLRAVDSTGQDRLPVAIETLSLGEPTFDATIMGTPKEVEWFLEITRHRDIRPVVS